MFSQFKSTDINLQFLYLHRTQRNCPEIDDKLTKLTDLPQLCLDKILLNLCINDLVNAANASNSLALSAVRVFSSNFKNEYIVFGFPEKPNSITDQKTFLSVLDHFGGKIERLISRVENQFILDRIVDKCHLNLHEWYIDCQHENININCQFPNLKKLSLVFFFDESFIDRIPNLETIDICKWNLSPFKDENPEIIRNVARFVNNNKQILNLFIAHDSSAIARLQQLIEWDEMMVEKLGIFTNYEPNLRNLRLGKNLRSLMLSAATFDNIKSFDLINIEELDIRSLSEPKNDGFLSVQQNSSLKKLKIRFIFRSLNEVERCTEFLQLLANNLLQIDEVLIDVWIFGNVRIPIEAKMFEILSNFVRRTRSDALQMIKAEIDCFRVRPSEQNHIHITRNRIGNWDSMVERKFNCYNQHVTISFNKRNI